MYQTPFSCQRGHSCNQCIIFESTLSLYLTLDSSEYNVILLESSVILLHQRITLIFNLILLSFFNIHHLCIWTSLRLLRSHSCFYNYLYLLTHNEFAFSQQADLKQGWVLHPFCFSWTHHLVLQHIREHQDVFITKMGE